MISNAFNGSGNVRGRMSRQWYDWIYKRVAENQPYDQLAAGMILATSRSTPEQSYKEYAEEMGSYFRKEQPADFTTRGNMPYFWQRTNVQKPEEKSLAFAHTFLGVRIECAQCHKHPFDQWTKTDFEQFQAFFTGLTQGNRATSKGEPQTEEVSYNSLQKEIKDKVTAELAGKELDKKKNNEQQAMQREVSRRLEAGELVPWPELYARVGAPVKGGPKNQAQGGSRVITPKILGGEEVMLQQYNDPREPLMAWLRDKENPYFAKAFVNRVWASYFSRGIVEPADDLNLANAPTNAPLLNYLADGFIAHGYDMKWLHREILNSDTYQRSWKPNPTNKLDEKNFSHAVIRRMPAEVVFDAMNMATTSSARVATFATDISDRAIGPVGNSAERAGGGGGKNADGYALGIFGKPARETNCDCERTTDPTLLQTIYTRNDPTFLARLDVANRNAWIDELRRQIAPSPDTSPDAIRQRIQKTSDKLAAMIPPPQPSAEDLEGQVTWKEAMERLEKQTAEIQAKLAEMKAALVEAGKPRPEFSADAAIRETFLRTVSRPPTDAELAKAKADLAAAPTPLDGIRDLLWAMLNTREFVVNH